MAIHLYLYNKIMLLQIIVYSWKNLSEIVFLQLKPNLQFCLSTVTL